MIPQRSARRLGLTLVELVIVIVLGGIVFATTPRLVLQGVKTMVFLPRALAVNQAAAEIEHQIIEGGFSTMPASTGSLILCGTTFFFSPATTLGNGLRYAIGCGPSQPAIWLAEPNRIGFVASNGQHLLVGLDVEVIKRSVVADTITCATAPAGVPGESLPYDAPGLVRIRATTGQLFRYYNQSGVEVPVVPPPSPCPPATTIRRVDVAFTAQTGNGVFDQGDAQEQVTSSVAIRVP